MSLFIFLLVRLTGDPADVLLPLDAGPDRYQQFYHEYGLDKPLPQQYAIWMGKLLTGDFGVSAARRVPVSQLIMERFPLTLQLAAAGFLVTVLFGLPLGIYSAAWKDGPLDNAARVFAAIGQAVPIFWLGIILILIFSVQLGWLPAGGRGGLESLILPAVTMGWFTTAGLLRVTRSAMLEVLSSDYVKLARIKGVSETKVLWKHALKNAALPIITFGSLIFFTFITGTIVTETVFAWPGLGTLVVQAVLNRDYAVVQVVVLFISAAYLLGNFVVDVLYFYINPRLRFS